MASNELSERQFPIQQDHHRDKVAVSRLPWDFLAPHEERAKRNHGGQSLERLAERQGLGWSEVLAILEDRDWKSIPATVAMPRVLELLSKWRLQREADLKAFDKFQATACPNGCAHPCNSGRGTIDLGPAGEGGWFSIAMHDTAGRRGVWWRAWTGAGWHDGYDSAERVVFIEMCAGREGGDEHAMLTREALGPRVIASLIGVLVSGTWVVEAAEVTGVNVRVRA